MANVEVPITILSTPSRNYAPTVSIGDVRHGPGVTVPLNSYWFSVYDRYTLKPVLSTVQTANADAVPADLSGKFNTPQYFLAVATCGLMSAFAPAGALHAFLVDTGAGVALKYLTQVFQQIGSGSLGVVSYAMAGALGPGAPSHPRVEASMINSSDPLRFAATLVGVPLPSGTLYSPYPLTAPAP